MAFSQRPAVGGRAQLASPTRNRSRPRAKALPLLAARKKTVSVPPPSSGSETPGRGRELVAQVEVLRPLEPVDVGEPQVPVLDEAQARLRDAEPAQVGRDAVTAIAVGAVQPQRADRGPADRAPALEVQGAALVAGGRPPARRPCTADRAARRPRPARANDQRVSRAKKGRADSPARHGGRRCGRRGTADAWTRDPATRGSRKDEQRLVAVDVGAALQLDLLAAPEEVALRDARPSRRVRLPTCAKRSVRAPSSTVVAVETRTSTASGLPLSAGDVSTRASRRKPACRAGCARSGPGDSPSGHSPEAKSSSRRITSSRVRACSRLARR